MHRFYLRPEECLGERLALTGREAHHAAHVLRLQRGQRLEVLDGAGGVCLCEVAAASGDRLQLLVLQRSMVPPPVCRVTILPGLLKGRAFELLVQKATELGASSIVPLLCERSVSRPQADAVEARLDKWRWIAVDALKQCGAAWLPLIDPPRTLAEQLGRCGAFELALLASLDAGRQPLRCVLDDFRSARGGLPTTVGVFIGPEGDFTRAESEAILAAGARPVTLGERVLRSETAALCALAVLNHEALIHESRSAG